MRFVLTGSAIVADWLAEVTEVAVDAADSVEQAVAKARLLGVFARVAARRFEVADAESELRAAWQKAAERIAIGCLLAVAKEAHAWERARCGESSGRSSADDPEGSSARKGWTSVGEDE